MPSLLSVSLFMSLFVAGSLLVVPLSQAQKTGVWFAVNSTNHNVTDENVLEPTVFIAILVRNKEHTLPYFLTLLEQLDYPKDRISIWIRSDHNEDRSPEILKAWGKEVDNMEKYHSVSVQVIDTPPYRHSDQNSSSPVQWTPKRFRHVIRLKEEAMRLAKKFWADYIWYMDADAFLVNNQTLKSLVYKRKEAVAPLLLSGSMYSNFWGGMQNYYYVRTEEYKEILDMKKVGCFPVPMIHSAILIDLRRKVVPSFNRFNSSLPEDDIILLAANAQDSDITLEICNDMEYGFIIAPLEEEYNLEDDKEQMFNLRVEIAAYWPTPLKALPIFDKWIPPLMTASTLGFDKIYLINLKRRPDRLTKMENALQILGLDYDVVEAVDGTELTDEDLDKMGIKQLPQYRDPYWQRVMTFGEIGCFMSHYKIWKDMLKNRVTTALVLEDDIRFEPYFVLQVQRLFKEAAKIYLDWDLMYLGRKRSSKGNEPLVSGSSYIAHVDYTYWTLGYSLTLAGAKKLVDAEPLSKLVPVDEYLPILFDRHNNDTWKSAFPQRNLKAYSAEPLLLYPTHYTGEAGYISDTERSSIILRVNCTETSSSPSCIGNHAEWIETGGRGSKDEL